MAGGGRGDEDDCSFMDVTVHSNAGSVGAAASPSTFAQQGSTTMIAPAGVTVTPIVTKNHPLALFSTDDAATTFSGGASSNQDARSVKSRITVATTGTTSSKAKRKLQASPQKATTRSTAFNIAIQKAD